MELDRRTKCNWKLPARPTTVMNEVRKIPRCRYLNRPSVESLDDKSHNGNRLIDLFRHRWIEKESMRRESSIDWRHWVDLQCWTIQVENMYRSLRTTANDLTRTRTSTPLDFYSTLLLVNCNL